MSGTLAQALIEAQSKLPAVPKNATAEVPTKSGGKYSYSYVTLDSLIAKTLPVLNEHGIAITQAPEFIDGYGLGLRTTLTHTSGETASSVMPIPHAGHSMQDLGGAITYARRYAWASVLGIASEHDDDAGAITNAAAAKPTPAAKPQSAPAPETARDGAEQPAATDKQRAMIRRLTKTLNLDAGDVDSLDKRAASARIEELLKLEQMEKDAAASGVPVGATAEDGIPF